MTPMIFSVMFYFKWIITYKIKFNMSLPCACHYLGPLEAIGSITTWGIRHIPLTVILKQTDDYIACSMYLSV